MPPKKKANKKAQNDDWEAELGESVAPQDAAPAEVEPKDAAAEEDDAAAAGGDLMAALAKRGKKKNKKGANPEVEGEDPPAADGANGEFENKAPQEGTFDDDEDDVFAGNYGKKKSKGGAAAAVKAEEPAEEKADGAPRVKTKAEKEKEKKEKEKQRKKELVCLTAQ